MALLDYSFFDEDEEQKGTLDYSFMADEPDPVDSFMEDEPDPVEPPAPEQLPEDTPSPYTADGSPLPEARSAEPSVWDSVQDFFSGGEAHRARASNELMARRMARRDGVSIDEIYDSMRPSIYGRDMGNPEGRAPIRAFAEGAGIVSEQLPGVPGAMANTVLRSIRGGDEDIDDDNWLDAAIHFTEPEKIKDPDPNYETINEIGKSIGYSLTSIVASSSAFAAATAVTKNPFAGYTAAAGAGGTVAFRGQKDEFMDRKMELAKSIYEEINQKEMPQAEYKKMYDEYNYLGNEYGAWEAIPESLSNLVIIRALSKPLRGLGKGTRLQKFNARAAEIAERYLATQAGEQSTETATGWGQNRVDFEAGLTDRKISIGEAFRQQALPTAIVTTGMVGGGSIVQGARSKIADSTFPKLSEPRPPGSPEAQAQAVRSLTPTGPPVTDSLDIDLVADNIKQEVFGGKGLVGAMMAPDPYGQESPVDMPTGLSDNVVDFTRPPPDDKKPPGAPPPGGAGAVVETELRPDEVETGRPIKFHYGRNTEKAPDMGSEFGQDIEPAGRYINSVSKKNKLGPDSGFEYGDQEFKNPLVIDSVGSYGEKGNWKNVLSDRYGATGEKLTKAIREDGYDGIITTDETPSGEKYVSEIVDVSGTPAVAAKTEETFGPKASAETEGPQGVPTSPPGAELNAIIDEVANEAATSPKNDLTEPTEAQKEAGNYKKGPLDSKTVPWLSGMDIAIENPAGSKRQPEWPALKNSYGYFKRTDAFDGDEVDVFVGPDMAEQPKEVFVIDQVDPETGQPDEHKVILGVKSAEEAEKVYLANYEKDWKGVGDIKTYAFDDFKTKLKSGFFKNSTPSRRLFPKQEALKTPKKKTKDEFKAHVAELREKKETEIQTLKDSNAGNIVGIEAQSTDGKRFAVVLPDASEPGKFRVQNYDKSSFSGHQVYNSEQEALDALWVDGYRTSAQGAMNKLEGTPAWKQGMKFSDQVRIQNEESFAKTKEREARELPLTKPTGKTTSIYIPAIDSEIKAKVSVVEGSALTISNDQDGAVNPAYPKELQPRNRKKGSSMLQIQKIANNLRPELLDDNGQSNGGSPIVGPDGVVESGNGRTLAILRAHQTKKGTAYRKYLKQNAASYGLTEAQIDAMDAPVLVRVRQGDMTMDERAEFARQSNQAGTAPMTPTENARADAKRITDKDMMLYAPSDRGNILAASNQSFLKKFGSRLGDLEVGGLSTPDGRWTKQFADRVQAAVFYKAYGSEKLLALTAEEADPDIKNVLSALNQAAPAFARARAVTEDLGKLDIVSDLVGAIDLLRQAKAKGSSISQEVDQGGLFGGVDPVVGQIATFIEGSTRSARKMGLGFTAMANALESELQSQSQEGLFDLAPITKADIVEAAKSKVGTEYGETDLFDPQDMLARRGEGPRIQRLQDQGFDTSQVMYHGTVRNFTEFGTPKIQEDFPEYQAMVQTRINEWENINPPPEGYSPRKGPWTLEHEKYKWKNFSARGDAVKQVQGILGIGARTKGGSLLRGPGFAFSSSPVVGSGYATPTRLGESGGHVIPVYLKTQNPKRLDAKGEYWDQFTDAIEDARNAGHDSVIIKNVVDDFSTTSGEGSEVGTTTVVFDPSQVRSVNAQGLDAESSDFMARRGDPYAAMAGKDVSYQVEVEDTGKSYTATIDSGQAMNQFDNRVQALKDLRKCI